MPEFNFSSVQYYNISFLHHKIGSITMNTALSCDTQLSPLGATCGSLPSSQSSSPVSMSYQGYGQASQSSPLEGNSCFGNMERASKRQKISSPPRPSLQFRRFPSAVSVAATMGRDDALQPPDIQRLSLPSLLHTPTDATTSAGFCPFGTR